MTAFPFISPPVLPPRERDLRPEDDGGDPARARAAHEGQAGQGEGEGNLTGHCT